MAPKNHKTIQEPPASLDSFMPAKSKTKTKAPTKTPTKAPKKLKNNEATTFPLERVAVEPRIRLTLICNDNAKNRDGLAEIYEMLSTSITHKNERDRWFALTLDQITTVAAHC